MQRRIGCAKGFTLIEVFIALVVVSIAFLALVSASTRVINDEGYLENKTIAHYVGLSALRFSQIGIHDPKLLVAVEQKTKFFNRQWYWTITIAPIESTPCNNLTIKVSDQANQSREHPLATVKGVACPAS